MIQKISKLFAGNYNNSKQNVAFKKDKQSETDNIFISDVAKQLSEVHNITKLTMDRINGGELKAEKLKIVKAKLENNEYDDLSPEILNKIADNITKVFFGNENKYFEDI
ncbi:MAG: flagellar biosynthesis anti-sigma factor FlgM [Leptospiraceae bacterium]|nr:flagellar biosynthesis anti-sigma factor FlgM [Leptospiraceae bacterium]MCP5495849.1 flagellar biosynthesis anti-sigma factor FlgM [Leptospiraceae bacterium]